jgi:hypothetical protein
MGFMKGQRLESGEIFCDALNQRSKGGACPLPKKVVRLPQALALGLAFFTGLWQAQGAKNWVGGTSGSPNDWNVPANWSPAAVPGTGDDVTIPGGRTYYPIVSAPAVSAIRTVSVNNGATVTLAPGGVLETVRGAASVKVDGTLAISGGTLTAYQDITGSGTVTMSGGALQIGHDWHLAPGQFSATGGTVEWTGQVGDAGSGGFPGGTGAYQFFNVLIDTGVDPGFDNKANNFVILGSWTNNGAASLTQKATAVSFNGGNVQTIAGSSMTTFNNLTISNSAGVSLGATATVNGTLTLSLGLLITGANQIDVAAAAVVVGGSSTSYVNGSLQKAFANAGNQSFTFPIGDTSTFTPLALSAFNVTSAGTLTARTAAGEHPNLQTSGINPAQDVNRYWTLSPQPGLGMSSCTATFTFVPADVDAGASTTNFIAKRFGGSWSATTVATAAATSTTMTGVLAYGDFALGMAGQPAPTLTSCSRQLDGSASIGLAGVAGWTYRIQASTDLAVWTELGAVTAGTNGFCEFDDPNASAFPYRFYRAVLP